jgi:hypothetical protein
MATTAELARISKYEAYSHEGEAFGLPSLAAQAARMAAAAIYTYIFIFFIRHIPLKDSQI